MYIFIYFAYLTLIHIQYGSPCTHQIVVLDESDIEVYTDPEDSIAEVALKYANDTWPNTQFNETDLQLKQSSDLFEIVYDTSARLWNLRRTGCLEAGYREWLVFVLEPHFGTSCNASLQIIVQATTRELLDVPSQLNISVCSSANEIDIYTLTVEEDSACIRLDCSTNMSEFMVIDRTVKAAVANISLNSSYTVGVTCTEAGLYPHKLFYASRTEFEINFSEIPYCLTSLLPLTTIDTTIKTPTTISSNNSVTTGPSKTNGFFNNPIKVAAVSVVGGIAAGVILMTTVYCLISKWCLAKRSQNDRKEERTEEK